MINKILNKIGFRILPYNFGDSLHVSIESKKVITYENDLKDKGALKNLYELRLWDYIKKLFLIRKFSAVNDQSVPTWLEVKNKKGVLWFKGTPYLDELNKNYIIRIVTEKIFIVLQFRLRIVGKSNDFELKRKPQLNKGCFLLLIKNQILLRQILL